MLQLKYEVLPTADLQAYFFSFPHGHLKTTKSFIGLAHSKFFLFQKAKKPTPCRRRRKEAGARLLQMTAKDKERHQTTTTKLHQAAAQPPHERRFLLISRTNSSMAPTNAFGFVVSLTASFPTKQIELNFVLIAHFFATFCLLLLKYGPVSHIPSMPYGSAWLKR
tara:strand:+ start:118 stop:612 length:495 start_codon:yes stop_codon:yes gene_type:complete